MSYYDIFQYQRNFLSEKVRDLFSEPVLLGRSGLLLRPRDTHRADIADEQVTVEHRYIFQTHFRNGLGQDRNAFLQLNARQRFSNAAMGTTSKNQVRLWTVLPPDVEDVRALIDRLVSHRRHRRQYDDVT